MKMLKLLGGQSQYFSDGAGDGSGGSEGAGESGAGEGGGSAGSEGGSNDGEGGSGEGQTGAKPTFAEELAGKTPEEIIKIAVDLQADRSKKNKRLESQAGIQTENDELKASQKTLTDRLDALEREKMTDAEKVVADAKKKATTDSENTQLLSDLAAENLDLRLSVAANSTGSKVTQEAFVKFALGEHLKANPAATAADLDTYALELKAQNPAAFGSGEATVDTGGGGGGTNVQGRATILSELEAAESLWKTRFTMQPSARHALTGRLADLRSQAAGRSWEVN